MKIRDRIKELRRVKASELIPNPKNWRTHPIAQQDALKGILAEVGFAGAVLARELDDGSLMLIDGHMRAEATTDQEIPVLILDVDEAESDKLLATFDPIAAMAESDPAALDALLRNVDTGSEALQKMLAELADGAGLYQDKEILEDEVPEPPADPITKPGDLWVLGDHRVLCGDSTKADDVGRLMGGATSTVVFTDPPYGVSVGKKNVFLNTFQKAGRCLENLDMDDMSSEELGGMLKKAFTLWRTVMADDCSVFVCSPQGGGLGMMMMMMMKESGLGVRHILNWVKNCATFSLGRLDYDYQHEPILFTWVKTHKRKKEGAFQTSVWAVDKPMKNKEHPTMKPVALPTCAILNHSDSGDIVADPFLGSGTTLIAAEQNNRKCYGMEISPAYCDVIVQRWEKLTGKTATLEVKNG